MSKRDDVRKIVIVRRKRGGHGGHHGGSWKVAYADFVTAMMAFFMVMWIMGMETSVKEMVQGYFNNPVGFKRQYSGGTNVLSAGNAPVNSDMRRLAMLIREHQRRRFEEAREQIMRRLDAASADLQALRAHIEIVITSEGMRIELLESGSGEIFFERGSATIKPAAAAALAIIGVELGDLPNPVLIEGHTDAAQYGRGTYSNWELSVDRANAARRVMTVSGLDGNRVQEVRGYADRQPRTDDPFDPANRRISILLPFQDPHGLGSSVFLGD